MESVICNKCGAFFFPQEVEHLAVKHGDMETRYMKCPCCLEKYHIFTTDSRMRELIERRGSLRRQIQIAQKKHLGRTLKRLLAEDKKLKAKQLKIEPELARQGQEYLKSEEGASRTLSEEDGIEVEG